MSLLFLVEKHLRFQQIDYFCNCNYNEYKVMNETKMNKCTIFYQSWQMQCCGTPFSVGDKVKWDCVVPENDVRKDGFVLDFYEEHHLTPTHTVSGTVKRIIAEYSEYPLDADPMIYEDSEVIQEETQYADGWNFERDDTDTRRSFGGYVVELEDATVSRYLVSPKGAKKIKDIKMMLKYR